ncbi:hypothetical protein [Chitinophaga sp. S165]|uniref:hypothetical protein n=1 Tax=Chitinophaga sp. S165 TaxID=2135462 RepID=UPI000D7148EB|nr:hypothetical protein [Chitinophaga sp. S165]PWV45823.1 hypothetical protein C7475_11240 [Chitinophaga sp. S165]
MTTNTLQPRVSVNLVHASPLESIRVASEYIANHNASLASQIEEIRDAIKQSKVDTAAASLAYASATEAETALTKDIDFLIKQLEGKQQEKENLEASIQLLELEIHDNDMSIRQMSSLYKNFPKNAPAEVLQLQIEGSKIIATSQKKLNFPCDLILALTDAKQPVTQTTGKATCLFLIGREDWIVVTQNKWSCDWKKKIKGLNAGSYQIFFSHLSVEEYDCKLSSPAPKIIII